MGRIISETVLTEDTFLIGNVVGFPSPTFKLRQKDIKLFEQEFPELSV